MADLPPRTRGVIALLEANCTVCMICARECPDWCIHIDSHTEVEEQPGSARPRARRLDASCRMSSRRGTKSAPRTWSVRAKIAATAIPPAV